MFEYDPEAILLTRTPILFISTMQESILASVIVARSGLSATIVVNRIGLNKMNTTWNILACVAPVVVCESLSMIYG